MKPLATALAALLATSAQAQTPDGLARGLTAYVPFDGSIAPRLALGSSASKSAGASYVEGRAGRALQVLEGVSLPGAGNFSRPRGSLAFWVRPDWTFEDAGTNSDRILFESTNFLLNAQRAKRTLFFMTGSSTDADGYNWDYNNADSQRMPNWKPGEWHHVALTWDSATGVKQMFLDGALAASNSTKWLRSDEFREAGDVSLGQRAAPGAYDEWAMWNRVLGADEIKLLFEQPAVVAARWQQVLATPKEAVRPPIELDLMRWEDKDAARSIVAPGSTFTARIPVRNVRPAAWSGVVSFGLLDFWGRTVAREKRSLSLAPGARQVLAVSFVAPQRGVYKIEAALEHGAQFFEKDVASFASFPKPSRKPFADSFFGAHVNAWSEGTVAQAARLGTAWNRGHNMLQHTWWPRVQRDKDSARRWDWSGQRSRMRRHGINVLGQWFATPYWAGADGTLPRPAADDAYSGGARPDLTLFRAYVRESVSNLGEVRFWEVWNEPEVSTFWSGSPQQFAALCNVATSEAKKANPKLQVLVAGWTQSGWKWHEAWAKAGGLRGADILSYHNYYSATATPEELERQASRQVRHWRGLMQRHIRRALPIWDSEGGSSDTTWLRGIESPNLPAQSLRTPFNWRAAAIASVQSAAIAQSLGVQKSFSYLWNPAPPDQYEDFNALDPNNAPKPKTIARATMQLLTDGARYAGTVKRSEARLWAGVWSVGPRQSLVCWWTGRGGSAFVSLKPRPSANLDLMGNAFPREKGPIGVSEVPTYLRVNASAAQVLAAIRGAPISVETRAQPEAGSEPSPVLKF